MEPHCLPAPTWDAAVQALLGAALEVHAHLGPGYLEPVYQEALAMEFALRSIPHEREVFVPVAYKGNRLAFAFRADFVCYGSIVIELKAVQVLNGKVDAQLRGYLNATGLTRGLLLNFGRRQLQFRRIEPELE